MTETEPPAIIAAYGLARPQLADLHAGVRRIFDEDGEQRWRELCATAGVDPVNPSGRAEDAAALERVLLAMSRHDDGAIRLCAQAFTIRQAAFAHLSTTDDLLRSTR
ncbi:MAG: hypothetical protein R2715_10130 [Ilumatobacteraceae bacterium]